MRASSVAVPVERRSPIRHWAVVARSAVSVLLLLFLFSTFHWSVLWNHLRYASRPWLMGAWLFFGIPIGLIALRWNLLLRVQGVRIPLTRVFAITCIGQFFNTFLLGSTGGDMVRVVYIIREAPAARARAGLSILVDRAFGFVVLGMMALVAASTQWRWFMSRPDLQRVIWVLIAIVLLSVAGVVSVLLVPLPAISARLDLPAKFTAALTAAYSAARQYVAAPAIVGSAVGLTVIVHLANMTAGYCMARALGLPVGFASMAVILAIVFFVIAVPVSVSGHGLREGIFVLMFSLFGIDSSLALAYSMCYLGLILTWSVACGPAYLIYKRGAGLR